MIYSYQFKLENIKKKKKNHNFTMFLLHFLWILHPHASIFRSINLVKHGGGFLLENHVYLPRK